MMPNRFAWMAGVATVALAWSTLAFAAAPAAPPVSDPTFHETLLCRFTAGTETGKIQSGLYMRLVYYPVGPRVELRFGWDRGFHYSSHTVYLEKGWSGIRFVIDDRMPTSDDYNSWGFYKLDFDTGMISHHWPAGVNRPAGANDPPGADFGFCQRLSPVLENFEQVKPDPEEEP